MNEIKSKRKFLLLKCSFEFGTRHLHEQIVDNIVFIGRYLLYVNFIYSCLNTCVPTKTSCPKVFPSKIIHKADLVIVVVIVELLTICSITPQSYSFTW
jgi:hypothetical protein